MLSAAPIDPAPGSGWRVGDRVRVRHQGRGVPGRISSVHRRRDGVEYVVRTDEAVGGIGRVINVWSGAGPCSYLHPATDGRQ